MGECGCDLQVHRCNEHATDVVLVVQGDHVDALTAALQVALLRAPDGWEHRAAIERLHGDLTRRTRA